MDGGTSERKDSSSASPRPQELTVKARKLTEDIQVIMTKFQSACKEARTGDISSMTGQVFQLLKDLQDEINVTSPGSPLPVDSLRSWSDDMLRTMRQQLDEQDDATSALAADIALKPELDSFEPQQLLNFGEFQKPELGSFGPQQQPNFGEFQAVNSESLRQQEHAFTGFYDSNGSGLPVDSGSLGQQEHEFTGLYDSNGSGFSGQNGAFTNIDDLIYLDLDNWEYNEPNGMFPFDPAPNMTPQISPPPTAFLGPKCALWDCQRPAQVSDYCSKMHEDLAIKEGEPGTKPVLRPTGIAMKDDRLLAALAAKMQGKHVGIPECHGAAIEKSPWKASELFDLTLLEGETLREWLFFDKPRRAFESGSRKQRSLSDYSGRGWHESRKQLMNELGGNKRSYYMDPQPPGPFEWHLFEFELQNSDVCALYKLELKLGNEKKTPRGQKVAGENGSVSSRKAMKDPLVDLEKQMERLTAKGSPESNKQPVTGRAKGRKSQIRVNG